MPIDGSSPRADPLDDLLPRAGHRMLASEYRRRVRRRALLAAAAGLFIAALPIAAAAAGAIAWDPRLAALLMLPFAAALLAAFIGRQLPSFQASVRARRIDGQLPFAVNYLSTMASGGALIERMLRSVASQPVYGPVAEEAALMHRDLTLLGLDTVGTLRAAIARSPSERWQDFLQGLETTLTSGGDVAVFLAAKSDQYFAEHRNAQKSFVESLGLLAEIFVVLVVATPTFLLVLLSVLTLFGRSGAQILVLSYALVLLILPLLHTVFAATVRLLTPEGTA